jgi:DNA-binding Xre family transcriptional regulator
MGLDEFTIVVYGKKVQSQDISTSNVKVIKTPCTHHVASSTLTPFCAECGKQQIVSTVCDTKLFQIVRGEDAYTDQIVINNEKFILIECGNTGFYLVGQLMFVNNLLTKCGGDEYKSCATFCREDVDIGLKDICKRVDCQYHMYVDSF